jgi:cold shock CspA family protein
MMPSWNSAATPSQGRATTGRITELSHGRLCGLILASDGLIVFFHGRDLEGVKFNDMQVGGSVSFELIDDRISGPRAARVRVAHRGPRARDRRQAAANPQQS